MRTHTLLPLLGALGVTTLSASAHAECPCIGTDRPGNGNAPGTVSPGTVQLETSVNYAQPAPGPDAWSAPTYLRVGVLSSVELRVGTSVFAHTTADGARGVDAQTGATDTIVGTKVQILEGEEMVPTLGTTLDVALPTGGDDFTADAVAPEWRLAATWEAPMDMGVLMNAGLAAPTGFGEPLEIVYLFNLNHQVSDLGEGVVAFAEFYTREQVGSSQDTRQIDVGASWIVVPDLQLDFFLQHGLTTAAPDFQAAMGLSVRI